MAGPAWLVDGNRIATKIKCASGSNNPRVVWKSNPSRACPNCSHNIDNSDVVEVWPGLPKGVKFDPSDQEIIWHLLAKVGTKDFTPHPFIDEFIPTVQKDDGICYTHPQNLPGVKQDGSFSHFFHRAVKAYNTGTRKRRKIHGDVYGDVRWHKTGRTKPVMLDGVVRGCKKIMVLYMTMVKGGKPEKANWVMHQYHLGTEEDEKDGEYVVSKVFFQQQQTKLGEKAEEDSVDTISTEVAKVDPVTPKSATPEPPRGGSRYIEFDLGDESSVASLNRPAQVISLNDPSDQDVDNCAQLEYDNPVVNDRSDTENQANQFLDPNGNSNEEDDTKWWDVGSQDQLDTQQLVEGLSLCDDILQSQSPNRDGNCNEDKQVNKPRLSDYARLGPEQFKKDLEDCQKTQNPNLDLSNLELDTPPDFRLSQLEFGSQDSYIAWGEAN